VYVCVRVCWCSVKSQYKGARKKGNTGGLLSFRVLEGETGGGGGGGVHLVESRPQ
jgi:hypothetical protein